MHSGKKTDMEKTWIKFKKIFSEAYHNMREQQRIATEKVGLHEATEAVDIGTTLDNLVNMENTDRDIVSKLSAAIKE